MPTLASVNHLIAGNGEFTDSLTRPGLRCAIGLAGDFGGGTVTASWLDASGNIVPYEDGEFTADGGIEVVVPGTTILLEMEGATDPEVRATISRIS